VRLAVIIPAHNAADTLGKCLRSIAESLVQPDRLIVVDDASNDGCGNLALAQGAEVVTIPLGPVGPAAARNQGASHANDVDVYIFFDADVVVHSDTIGALAKRLANEPSVDAMFGSYDECPPEKGLASLYKNLLHHYVHQTSRREASTFWAGCGAIRRSVFEAVGGFDEMYSRPSIEDIELGTRLRKQGYHIRLYPEVQVKHLKKWSFGSMVRTDVFCRAVPWTRLMLREGNILNDLNVSWKYRLSALVAGILVGSLAFLPVFPTLALFLGLTSAALFIGLHLPLLQFFAKQGGVRFTIAAGILHLFYYLYSSAAFTVVLVPHRVAQWYRNWWKQSGNSNKPQPERDVAELQVGMTTGE